MGALDLPLLGGRTGAEVEGHDWEYLLTSLGIVHLDKTIGAAAWRIGLATMVAAPAWGGVILRRSRPPGR